MNKGVSVWPLSLRLAHWASAMLVVAALGLGTYMVQLVHDPAERFELTQTHKSIGVAVLALTVVRLCLRILANAPKPEPAAPLVLLAAKVGHIVLYGLLLVMPLSGVDGNDNTSARADFSIRTGRVALSLVDRHNDVSDRPHHPCRVGDLPRIAHRPARRCRHHPRVRVARSHARADVVETIPP